MIASRKAQNLNPGKAQKLNLFIVNQPGRAMLLKSTTAVHF